MEGVLLFRVPAACLTQVELCRRPPLALEQARPLIAAQEAPELLVAVARLPAQEATEVPDRHAEATHDERRPGHSVRRAPEHVHRRRAHEVLATSVPFAARPPTLVACPHRAQVGEAQRRVVPRDRDPAKLPAAVSVDAVPHDLPYEATDLSEARRAIELGHAHRVLVADLLRDQPRAVADGELYRGRGHAGRNEVWFPRARADARLSLYAVHKDGEVSGRQVEVQVELADVVVGKRIDGLVTRVEGIDHAPPHLADAALGSANDPHVREPRRVLLEDLWRLVLGAVVHKDPPGGRLRLARDRLQGAARILGLLAARCDQATPSGAPPADRCHVLA